jgi:demethylmenaquinone methyltransferase/2-methoxy-6-polyprenyl-1,4-benzoquinol methylase
VIGVAASLEAAIRRYDRVSRIYDWNAGLGSAVSARALAMADPCAGERVVEIGVGTGRDLVALRTAVGPTGRVVGIDLSMGMLRRSSVRLRRGGLGEVSLQRADARAVPLPDGWANLVFCSRVLDLVDAPAIGAILQECRRLLRPGGRLVLLHMSKRRPERSWFERLYASPLGIGGGLFVSRPVVAAPFLHPLGFQDVARVYMRSVPVGSEIVLARLPPR